MKRSDFETIYASAKTVKIFEDSWFNCSGWFWLNLTEKQWSRMLDLLAEQETPRDESGWYVFKNGMKIQSTLA